MNFLSKATRRMSRHWLWPGQSGSIPITFRGRAIDQEDLFRYTNGRFLIREKQQCESRYVKFNLQALCDIAASAGTSKSPIRAIEKLEGGFSKALLLLKEDGSEVVAKIPSPFAGPSGLVTASEAAVMKFVRTHTTIPVPKIFAWDSDPSNPVGAEYIIMEKAPGVQLFKVWADMEDTSRYKLVSSLARFERQLASIEFPANGSLYFREGMKSEAGSTVLSSSTDPEELYCIGLSCDRVWWPMPNRDLIGHPGPWSSCVELGFANVDRESYRIVNQPRDTNDGRPRGETEEQLSTLKAAGQLLEALKSYPKLNEFSKPTLYHTDLHMGNIYVDQEDPSTIVSIIDWQHTQVAPLFMQARWPVFLEPKGDYPVGLVLPNQREDFDSLNEDDKCIAKEEYRNARTTKAYELKMRIENWDAYKAKFYMPRSLQEFFIRSGEVWEEGCIPLRECLIEIHTSWKNLQLPGDSPFQFEEKKIEAHGKEFEEYDKWHAVKRFAIKYLFTDSDGWISPELDFKEITKQNRELFDLFANNMADGKSREEVRRTWPFTEAL